MRLPQEITEGKPLIIKNRLFSWAAKQAIIDQAILERAELDREGHLATPDGFHVHQWRRAS
jgi:hypothetical protein